MLQCSKSRKKLNNQRKDLRSSHRDQQAALRSTRRYLYKRTNIIHDSEGFLNVFLANNSRPVLPEVNVKIVREFTTLWYESHQTLEKSSLNWNTSVPFRSQQRKRTINRTTRARTVNNIRKLIFCHAKKMEALIRIAVLQSTSRPTPVNHMLVKIGKHPDIDPD